MDGAALMSALREATRRLPELKYAWGLLGLMAVAAIAIRWFGEGKASLLAGGAALIGFVLVVVATLIVRKGGEWLQVPAKWLTWSITVFFIVFLLFTVTAYAASWPCNWVRLLEIATKDCGDHPSAQIDIRRLVDFSALGCTPDGKRKEDLVVFTDVVSFVGGLLPTKYVRPFNVTASAEVTVKDLVANTEHKPSVNTGGAVDFGQANYAVDPIKREAKLQWIYKNGHSGPREGVGFTDSKDYVIRAVDVTYKFPAAPGLSERKFDPARLEDICHRRADGFSCANLNTAGSFREVWKWEVWKGC